jgi:hypothetical protein
MISIRRTTERGAAAPGLIGKTGVRFLRNAADEAFSTD